MTPRFAEAVTIAIVEAGLQHVVTFVQGDGGTGAALVGLVDFVCFTGSVATGKKVCVCVCVSLSVSVSVSV